MECNLLSFFNEYGGRGEVNVEQTMGSCAGFGGVNKYYNCISIVLGFTF